ncbi:hypothetical protein SISSUDRAFT_1048081 [Sistotremastrum suecicum HHB10207 ss-3]|uniref:Uncharacterized protein n=1 Tax=Sistotremastrum suecicum HHB10207 ss-3 TaxID=1314776 RepID=A0A166CPC8_9AGAM|nr:hypothetical protein SISSUDRAFT_1048081 [Sistotremastrum suecicum HHB10207 ss-3]
MPKSKSRVNFYGLPNRSERKRESALQLYLQRRAERNISVELATAYPSSLSDASYSPSYGNRLDIPETSLEASPLDLQSSSSFSNGTKRTPIVNADGDFNDRKQSKRSRNEPTLASPVHGFASSSARPSRVPQSITNRLPSRNTLVEKHMEKLREEERRNPSDTPWWSFLRNPDDRDLPNASWDGDKVTKWQEELERSLPPLVIPNPPPNRPLYYTLMSSSKYKSSAKGHGWFSSIIPFLLIVSCGRHLVIQRAWWVATP